MKIILAGGTGFIGLPLAEALVRNGYEVFVLTRNPKKSKGPAKFIYWDGATTEAWQAETEEAYGIINLTGEGIANKRWSPQQKKKILESRLNATSALVAAVQSAYTPPKVWVNASAVGYYGDVSRGEVTESAPAGKDFLARVCTAWEAEAQKAEEISIRTIRLRIGVVLEKNGGAIQKMIPPFYLFAGGPLGSGEQAVSWIHREDLIETILYCLKNDTLSGAVNATAPNPVTMKVFSKELGRALHRPSWLPVPAFALKLLLGELSEMLLTGQRVVPEKLIAAGFTFRYPTLPEALDALFKPAR